MSKKTIRVVQNKPKFEFDDSFKETFNALIDVFIKASNKLDQVASGKTIKSDYGVCNCCYRLRYITPNDVSTYVSNLTKGLNNGLFYDMAKDIDTFTVASVKRFMETNGCPPFESSSVLDNSHRYVNPKNQTLNDLAFICENDIGEVAVYSRGEMAKRIELMNNDVKKINDMHFAANMKKIVAALPGIIEKSDDCCYGDLLYQLTLTRCIQDFILFACTINTIAVLQLIEYGNPSTEYTVKPKEEGSDNMVTECCLMKTNDYMIRNNLPFNCNMRDIVLQDVTPKFKDTHDALHFIMRDPRSPISTLVNRYATQEAKPCYDYELISRLFFGTKIKHGRSDEWYTKDGNITTGCPRCSNGFKNKPAWLDTIAFGNNYLDGNYRRDAVGNNHTHSIVNTLDSVYKMFGGCDMKTNEDVANNIVRVACLMREVIHQYKETCTENYDMTKDVLVLLGEIMTRNMLRLYYNNTRVYCYDDNMPDAAIPGFLCMESFVMEADENTTNGTPTAPQQPASQQTTQQKPAGTSTKTTGDGKTTVSFSNKQGETVKKGLKVTMSSLITKFIQWVRTQLGKFSENFNKNHKQEIEWIKNNMELNKEIANAIKAKKFVPNVSNLPMFNIPADKIVQSNLTDLVKKMVDPKIKPEELQKLARKASSFPEDIIDKLDKIKDAKEYNDATMNYILFGNIDKPQYYTGPLTAERWDELCKDLLETPEMIAKICKAHTDDLTSASTFIQDKIKQLEQLEGEAAEKNEQQLARCKEIYKTIQGATRNYKVFMLNTLNNKFYSKNYTIYREIVAGYKQQSKNFDNSDEDDKTTNTEEENDTTENTTDATNTSENSSENLTAPEQV